MTDNTRQLHVENVLRLAPNQRSYVTFNLSQRSSKCLRYFRMGAQKPTAVRDDQIISLPKPRQSGGKPLLDTLRLRRSSREFDVRELDVDILSDLLWAAFGVNRSDGHRTAPSARNWQEVDIYVASKGGLYLLDPTSWTLKRISSDDVRAATGMQDFVATAPLNLIYVADLSRTDSHRRSTSGSSVKTYTCSARRRGWRPSFAAWSIVKDWLSC